MQLGKLLLVATIAVLAFFSTQTEAKHKRRSRGWRKLVHRRCVKKDQAVVAVGGEINSKMIRVVKRAIKKKVRMTIVINGKDLIRPTPRKNRRRNVKFIKKVASKVNIAVLPWSTKHRLTHMRLRKVLRLYKKSAKAIKQVVHSEPLVAHLSPEFLKKKIVKYLSKKGGFTIIGGTTKFKDSEKDLSKKSFIALQHPKVKRFSHLLDNTKKGMFKIVNLNKCLNTEIYKGGLTSNKHKKGKGKGGKVVDGEEDEDDDNEDAGAEEDEVDEEEEENDD